MLFPWLIGQYSGKPKSGSMSAKLKLKGIEWKVCGSVWLSTENLIWPGHWKDWEIDNLGLWLVVFALTWVEWFIWIKFPKLCCAYPRLLHFWQVSYERSRCAAFSNKTKKNNLCFRCSACYVSALKTIYSTQQGTELNHYIGLRRHGKACASVGGDACALIIL